MSIMDAGRKRPHADEDTPIAAKKRVLTSSNGTPHVNGNTNAEPEEPRDAENLELFRKEAIFRRMKHYSRENDRNQLRIAELERRKSNCEAGLAAMSACWNQLVETVRLLTKPEDLPEVDTHTKEILNLAMHVSEESSDLATALDNAADATSNIVSKFVQLGEANLSVLHDKAYVKAQEAQTECAVLRSEVDLLRSRLEQSELEKTKFHTDLVAAETRADRLQSATVQNMHTTSDHPLKRSERVETAEAGTASALAPIENGHSHDPAHSEWVERLAVRDKIISEQDIAITKLRTENNELKLNMVPLFASLEQVSRSPHFQVLADATARLQQASETALSELAQLTADHQALQQAHTELMDRTDRAATTEITELKGSLSKRETENARLRDQREQQSAELNERRQRESVKMQSMQELKTLADSRLERIAVLQSEVVRLKAQLAVNANNKDLMKFLFNEEGDYVDTLKQQLSDAQERIATLEQSLSAFQEQCPDVVEHVKAETEARQQLAEAMAQLDKYRVVYGESSTADIQLLSHALQQKEDEIERLRLRESHDDQAKDLLYAEMDKLSAAWETLDKQVKSRVFDLSSMEDRLVKIGYDKAKSDNKFFAAMRERDAVDNERKNLIRNFEKQSKTLDKMLESNTHNINHVRILEVEISKLRQLNDEQKRSLSAAQGSLREGRHFQQSLSAAAQQLQLLVTAKDVALDQSKSELRKLQDTGIRLKGLTEQQAVKIRETSGAVSTSAKEQALTAEVDNCMKIIKCSTCKQAMRSRILIKCSHTFCKDCLDLRISTRQRKCPTCNLAFAASEVQPVFFN